MVQMAQSKDTVRKIDTTGPPG
ncbi:MAG: hypothetical protein JWQ60_4514, partial [Pseudonocardia sp.]|nr:hypothetical protein [Pseudonocardia sp.]